MIVPDGLSLEELIGALKVEVSKSGLPVDEMMGLAGHLNTLEAVKRELDKRPSGQAPVSKGYAYLRTRDFVITGDLDKAYMYLKKEFKEQ